MDLHFLAAAAGLDELLWQLFIVFAAAKVAAELFERIRQPAVVGEILVGVLLGPSVLTVVEPSQALDAFSEIGVILLLFTVGLEVNPTALFRVGHRALMVALGGVILPFAVGWALMTALGYPTVPGVFMGAALVATSVGITARVLSGLGLLSTRSAQIILGAAVIDDILGLLVLTVVSGSAEGELRYGEIATVATLAIGFTAFMIIAGARIARRARPVVEHLKVGNAFFISAIALCLGLSLLATRMGVAPIIGAFLAGMALAEASEDTRLHHEVGAVTEFLVPFFLVGIGMQLQVAVFSNWQVLALSLGVTLAAIATKLLGCGAFALGSGRRSALQVGIGMVPRGEVGIIVAQVGRKVGALDDALYAVVVFMAVATTMIAPPLLTRLFRDEVPIEIADVDEVVDSDRELADLQ